MASFKLHKTLYKVIPRQYLSTYTIQESIYIILDTFEQYLRTHKQQLKSRSSMKHYLICLICAATIFVISSCREPNYQSELSPNSGEKLQVLDLPEKRAEFGKILAKSLSNQ